MKSQADNLIFVLSAPSGAGKTSLIGELLVTVPHLQRVITHTTRPMREGEVNGVDYHFVTQDQFNDMLSRNEFVEHASVFDHSYGTAAASIEVPFQKDSYPIINTDWQGAQTLMGLYPNQVVSIFVMPPSMAALKQRLETRGQDSQEVIAKRLAVAESEMSQHVHFDYLLVNDQFEHAVSQIRSIISAEPLKRERFILSHQAQIEPLISAEKTL